MSGRKVKKESKLERDFLFLWRTWNDHLPAPVRGYRFAQPRDWEFDIAWPEPFIAVELEGDIWPRRRMTTIHGIPSSFTSPGRHTTGVGYQNDCRKYNVAQLLGWKVLRFTNEDLHSYAIGVMKQVALAINGLRPAEAEIADTTGGLFPVKRRDSRKWKVKQWDTKRRTRNGQDL